MALRRTYGYEPVAFSTSSPAVDLTNAVVLCRIRSWLTARRMVALPFADHCEPLVEHPEDQTAICGELQHAVDDGTWKFVELRTRNSSDLAALAARVSASYCLHTLDLRPPLTDLFRALHKDCIQRKIRRAEREALSLEQGRSDELVAKFYQLLVLTR